MKTLRRRNRPLEYEIDSNGCFICTSHSLDKDGYPKLCVNRINYRGHRFIYEQCFGPIPEKMVIRHKCDNPSCINPEHLELGTIADNNKDKVIRGRINPSFGEKNGYSKLSEKDVVAIKAMLNTTRFTHEIIGNLFQVNRKTVSKIANGLTWRNVE